MTRTHGGPLIIPAEKQPYPISPRVIKYSPSADRGGRDGGGGEKGARGDNRFLFMQAG